MADRYAREVEAGVLAYSHEKVRGTSVLWTPPDSIKFILQQRNRLAAVLVQVPYVFSSGRCCPRFDLDRGYSPREPGPEAKPRARIEGRTTELIDGRNPVIGQKLGSISKNLGQ
eukprot:176339-Prorocentrum_minimum.AAC.1